MPKIKIVDVNILPICPHCGKELDRIERLYKGIISATIVYMCPYCKKVLSIGNNL